MEELFTIGEVAKLLDVPTATLRFWEEKGLFSVEKGENRYRHYTHRDLVRIASVVFYRNLGIPVAQVHWMNTYSLEQYTQQIRSLQSQLEEQLNMYQRMYRRTQNELGHLAQIEQLAHQAFLEEEVPFDAVASFDYREKEKLVRYAQDPSCYVRYTDTRDTSSETRGIIALPEYPEHTLLWKKRPDTVFLTFLIRELAEEGYQSDVEHTLSLIRREYRTGTLLSQYLITARENGRQVDYLKGYLEVFPL